MVSTEAANNTTVATTATKDINITPRTVELEMKTSYIDYAMSVIVGRALPDVRDGLKPVHRRILYAMHELGNTSDKPYKKSARVVGEVLGKYHPHGDVAVYDSLVRMAQGFSLRYPLVDGQGNFGSIDGDMPAAMRYTECRMTKIAEEMLLDIDKNTVDFVDNFDGTLQEPTVLPAKFPNLLVNGSSGIAVGMATNIPPHNLGEIIDGIVSTIDKPDIQLNELIGIVKGPDFPTGGIIYGVNGIVSAYSTGRGLVRVRARTKIEDMGREKKRIVVYELPYSVNKAELLESIAGLVKEKKIEGIVDLRDESDREGMRMIIELRAGAVEDVVLNQLFKHTQLESTFGVINLALVNNQPQILTLKEMLQHYVDYRTQVTTRRLQYELKKAEARLHILEGLIIALNNIDAAITIIRKSKNVDDAYAALMSKFNLSVEQAKSILDMRLQKLTSMEIQGVKDEHLETTKNIAILKDILSDRNKILKVIKDELLVLKEKYADKRRTEIIYDAAELNVEDLVPVEDVVVTITNSGYIKRIPLDAYRSQRRGGKGLIGMDTKESDFVTDLFITSTHNYILFFSNKGKAYWLKAYEIPVGSRYSKGKAIINLLPSLEQGEMINAMIPVKEFDDKHDLIMATKKGVIKKTVLSAYGNPRATGIIAINLDEGDELVETKLSDGTHDITLATRNGQAIRFSESNIREIGRATRGVRGITLEGDDEVVSMAIVDENSTLLSITEHGYGKRTMVSEYRKTNRGGKGVITIITSERNGKVVAVKEVTDNDELVATSSGGMVIRIPITDIKVQGRNTQGFRIMRLDEGDKVIAVARIAKESDNGNGQTAQGGNGQPIQEGTVPPQAISPNPQNPPLPNK
jgi:DNA gyrase subunit A